MLTIRSRTRFRLMLWASLLLGLAVTLVISTPAHAQKSCDQAMELSRTCGSDSACLQRAGLLFSQCADDKRNSAESGTSCRDKADACAYRCADLADYSQSFDISLALERHQSCLTACSEESRTCRASKRTSTAPMPTRRPPARVATYAPGQKQPPLVSPRADCREIPAVTKQLKTGQIVEVQEASADCTYHGSGDVKCVTVPPLYKTETVSWGVRRVMTAKPHGICMSVNARGQSCRTHTDQYERSNGSQAFRRTPSYSTCKAAEESATAPEPLAPHTVTASGNKVFSAGAGAGGRKSQTRTANSASDDLAAASDLGQRNALKCVTLERTSDNLTAIRNVCGQSVNYGYCYYDWTPDLNMASNSNPFKCDGTGQPGWGAADSVAAGATKTLPLQRGARRKSVNVGPCMSEVRIDDQVFRYLQSKKLSTGNVYTCRYTQKN